MGLFQIMIKVRGLKKKSEKGKKKKGKSFEEQHEAAKRILDTERFPC